MVTCLALGRVSAIQKACRSLFDRLGTSLAEGLRQGTGKDWSSLLDGWVYRFFSQREMAGLLRALGTVLNRFGSLEEAFGSVWPEISRGQPLDFSALSRFSALFWAPELGILLPKPGTPGAFKRVNLFLRWMVRRDEVDGGTWSLVPPQALLMPVDTHVLRWAQEKGVCRRAQADAKACLEITAFFRSRCPEDPVKYDFSLTREGMLGA